MEMKKMREYHDEVSKTFGDNHFSFDDLISLFGEESAYYFLRRGLDEGLIAESKSEEHDAIYYIDETYDEKFVEKELKPDERKRIPKGKSGSYYEGFYSGTKYHLRMNGDITWVGKQRLVVIKMISGSKPFIDELRKIKLAGSFKINEYRDVLTKDWDENVIYIGKASDPIEIELIEKKPTNVYPGSFWPSIYDGSKYHFGTNGKIWYQFPDGSRVFTKSGHDKLVDMLKKYKPQGGSFRINEEKNVITLLTQHPFPPKIRDEINKMSDEQRRIIESRLDLEDQDNSSDDPFRYMVPIYLGHFQGTLEFHKKFDLTKPWEEDEKESFISFLETMGG